MALLMDNILRRQNDLHTTDMMAMKNGPTQRTYVHKSLLVKKCLLLLILRKTYKKARFNRLKKLSAKFLLQTTILNRKPHKYSKKIFADILVLLFSDRELSLFCEFWFLFRKTQRVIKFL